MTLVHYTLLASLALNGAQLLVVLWVLDWRRVPHLQRCCHLQGFENWNDGQRCYRLLIWAMGWESPSLMRKPTWREAWKGHVCRT